MMEFYKLAKYYFLRMAETCYAFGCKVEKGEIVSLHVLGSENSTEMGAVYSEKLYPSQISIKKTQFFSQCASSCWLQQS